MRQTIDATFELESDGHAFTECPRWHDGQLYFSDVKAHRVHRLRPGGKAETLLEIADEPSGLGFMPNGDLLVVSMHDQTLLRRRPDGKVNVHADLSAHAHFGINDMVVDQSGRAYVAQFGFDTTDPRTLRPSPIIVVEPDGRVHEGPNGVMVANGMVLTPDGRTLIFAESAGGKISAYDSDRYAGRTLEPSSVCRASLRVRPGRHLPRHGGRRLGGLLPGPGFHPRRRWRRHHPSHSFAARALRIRLHARRRGPADSLSVYCRAVRGGSSQSPAHIAD